MNESLHIERTGQWKTDDVLFCVARQPESTRLILGSSDFHVYEFDVATEDAQRTPFSGTGHRSYVTGLAMAGDLLVTGSYDRQLIWWDTNERKPVRAIEAHDQWIRRVTTTPDTERILSIADDMQCKVWDAETGEQIATFSDHAAQTPHHYPSMLYALTASPCGRWLATGDRVGHVAIWDAATFEKVGELECPIMYTWDPKQRRHSIGGIRSLAFSPDGTQLAVGGIGTIGNIDHLGGPARLEVFEWSAGDRLLEREDETHKGLIEQIAWASDASLLLTAGGDHKGFLTIYEMPTGELLTQTGSDGHLHAFSADESLGAISTVGHQRIETWTVTRGPSSPEPTED